MCRDCDWYDLCKTLEKSFSVDGLQGKPRQQVCIDVDSQGLLDLYFNTLSSVTGMLLYYHRKLIKRDLWQMIRHCERNINYLNITI
jgi:hypothetical protein